ncbi:hypothetical protein IC229_29560 [Spirosoma sp. BT702]|uniref:Uncharacterized protein n=1 Tax=Spirosoma profusum TaxID=2771354 RepID=A0A927GA59_9BACT|nr:hypothetical protein [Spirosoma profusum]MBD2704815.1 hypothetical protein [Spirosoma profusum]
MYKVYFYYLFKYYKFNQGKYLVSLLCFFICYLSIELVFSFSSIIESDAQQTYNNYFQGANFILTSPLGIKFDDKGKLSNTPYLKPSIVNYYLANLQSGSFSIINRKLNPDRDFASVNYLIIFSKTIPKKIVDFNNESKILNLNSYINADSSYDAILYDIKGTKNRFAFFSFENQISAFILGSELSSESGLVSRLMFLFSVLFTLYISVLYFQERHNEFSILVMQGYLDENMKIIFIDCILQNLVSFVISITISILFLFIFTSSETEFTNSLGGFFYIIPYFPIIVIMQFLLLFSKAIDYESYLK